MIQKGTRLNVVDNSGAKIAYCIQNITHPSCRYAYLGDLLLVSIKKLRVKRINLFCAFLSGCQYLLKLFSPNTCPNEHHQRKRMYSPNP